MNLSFLQKTFIILKGTFAISILGLIVLPFVILPENARDEFFDWSEKKLLKLQYISFIFENLFLWSVILEEVLLDDDKSYWMLKYIAENENSYTCPSVQKQLFALQLPEINSRLIKNPHLIPQLFSPLFLEASNRDKLLVSVQRRGFQYHHPTTQAQLDKVLLLL